MDNMQNNNLKMKKILTDADDAACKACGSIYFEPIFRVKRVSAFMSPTGQEIIVPVQVLRCQNCHAVLNDTRDFDEKNEENVEKTPEKETKPV